jgi:hypothetical protein
MASSPLTSWTKRETAQKMFTVAATQHVITRRRTGLCPPVRGTAAVLFPPVSGHQRCSRVWFFCGCGSYTKPDNAASRSPSELGLHVESQGSDLRLIWNRHSPLFPNATGGILIIEDGDRPKRELPLTAAILQTGSVLYQPTSKNVRFHFRLRPPTPRRSLANRRLPLTRTFVHRARCLTVTCQIDRSRSMLYPLQITHSRPRNHELSG